MQIVSIINYKGGVGKTTLTANLGAYLARLGKRILLIDLDPQCSLTFSFYAPDEASRSYPANRTLAQWYGSFVEGAPQRALSEFVSVPKDVNDAVAAHGGFVGLVPSSIDLIDVDESLLVGAGMHQHLADQHIYKLRCALSAALRHPALGSYDFVLIDCPPSFSIVTQGAIVASDHFLVPASPDYLSTLGTGRLLASVDRFVHKFNLQVREYSNGPGSIHPTPLGVVFTMVKYGATGPNSGHSFYMEQVRRSVGDIPVFGATLRENVAFGKENPRGVPVILKLAATNKVYIELMELANEFLRGFEGGRMKAVA